MWTFEHSVTCLASKEFAWRFWTDVNNWKLDSDVESVELDGEFVAGGRGATQSKASGRIEWRIAEAEPGRAVIQCPAAGATVRFEWTFADHDGGVRITQRISLTGEQADEIARMFGPALEAGIPAGMRKLCDAMERASGKVFSIER